ncbi:SseB family protein [Streptomyces sp. NPDC050610]|uniref:SseB family protein n=1 Tax=Streptomyces sp. NPDC050610 TaxID=3157097 RepID=UPI00343D077F
MNTPMDLPSDNGLSPAQQALNALSENAQDVAALDTLAGSDVLIPVPDELSDAQEPDSGDVVLPIMEQPGGAQLVPVFTSELRMAELLPSISRYRMVPLGTLASQWPAEELSLAIDASSPGGLTLDAQGVRTLLVRPHG